MKKIILKVTTIAAISFMLCACGSNEKSETATQPETVEITATEAATTQEVTTVETTTKKKKKKQEETTTQIPTTKVPVTAAPTTKSEEQTTEKKTEKKTTTKKTKSKDTDKKTAEKYIGKSLDSLVSAIGKYKTSEKAPSCLYEGESDGIFYWSDFCVSAHTKNGKWIVDSVE